MSRKKADERIGTEFTTNYKEKVMVIDYVNSKEVQIMFLDEHRWTTWTQWSHLQRGQAVSPFTRTVYGVGYLGVDKQGNRPKVTDENGKNTREYQLWSNMMNRCYNEKYHEKEPSYKNCTVCERWHCYVNFLEDLPKIQNYEYWRDNPLQRISLNKDMFYTELGIETDCKEYNLKTVRFITIKDNAKEVTDRWGKHIMPLPPKKVRCIETGITYESIIQAERETGILHQNIVSVCKGKRKTTGGYTWEYVD